MAAIRNVARERLENGELSIGAGVRLSRTVDIAKVMRTCGFDWLFIDMEHGPLSIESASQIAVAALDVGIAPLVRVPMMDFNLATRILDGGGLGIVMPHVDTAEQAREIVDRLKYPPVGHRSVGGPMPQSDYGPATPDVIQALDAATMVVVMIESPLGVENADSIAAVDGVDVLLIGTNDLATEMGIPGRLDHDRVADAYRTVVEASNRHGKWAGLGGIGDEALIKRYIDMGVRFILAGNDTGYLVAAGSRRAQFVRGCLDD
jgi:2-keto-3-deoxy-L-rhamnonate aldolase RhmA